MAKSKYIIDINADLGEGYQFDSPLMALVTSASIACGGHAGDTKSMQQSVLLAKHHGVHIGAHPSYPDPGNFGRQPMHLAANELTASLIKQISALDAICDAFECKMHYVKPHGALYNQVAHSSREAHVLFDAMQAVNPNLALMALANSPIVALAQQQGITVIAEAFADRRYLSDGQLSPRSQAGSTIDKVSDVVQQAKAIASGQPITTIDNQPLTIAAQSLCLHGDNVHALQSAEQICQALISR